MKFVSRLAVAAAFTLAAPVAMTAIATPAIAQAMSPAVGKPLQEAQKLAGSGNLAAASQRLAAARSAAKSPVERKKVAEMAAYVHTRAGRYGAAAQELESVGAGAGQLAPLYYRAGNYAKAIALGKKMGNGEGQTIVAQSYIKMGKFAEAAGVYQKLIKTGGPRQQWLENLAAAQFKMGDKKAYLATTEQLIRTDPTPARWRALLSDLKSAAMPREAKLGLFHLMRETGNVTKPEDYAEFAKLAIVAGQAGVAKKALDEAKAANAIAANDQMTARMIEAADKRASADLAAVAKLPKTPDGQIKAGNVYLGSGDYAKAAAAFGAAAKAGGATVDNAKLLQGIAQLRAGQAAAASATFKSVTGAGYSDVAALWALYTSTRKG